MKKTIKTGLILLCLSSTWCFYHTISQNSLTNDLAFENIEALASYENGEPDENFQCYNDGEVDCYGYKVEYKISGFSLD